MKFIILLSMMVICSNTFCQTAHKATKSKKAKYQDSVYYETTSDTLYGVISYKEGNGTIQGDGIIVKIMQWEYHKTVPERPPHYYIEGKDTMGISFDGVMGMGTYNHTNAYIQTNKGYLRVSEKYTFTPKLNP